MIIKVRWLIFYFKNNIFEILITNSILYMIYIKRLTYNFNCVDLQLSLKYDEIY